MASSVCLFRVSRVLSHLHLLRRKDNLPSAQEPALLPIVSPFLSLPLLPRDAAVKKLAYVHAVCSDKDSVPTAPSSTIEASPAGPRLHLFVPRFHCLPPTAFTKCKGAVPHCSGSLLLLLLLSIPLVGGGWRRLLFPDRPYCTLVSGSRGRTPQGPGRRRRCCCCCARGTTCRCRRCSVRVPTSLP